MNEEQELNRQQLLNTQIMTPKEARIFIQEKLHIGDTYYYDCIWPLIRDKFHPMLKNFRRGRPASQVILKKDVENFVIHQMENLIKKTETQ